jgi:hypothetical protein
MSDIISVPYDIFEDSTIEVDGRVWWGCTFIRCKLIRHLAETQLWDCIYRDCEYVGDGWKWLLNDKGW